MVFSEEASLPWYIQHTRNHQDLFRKHRRSFPSFHMDGRLLLPLLAGQNGSVSYSMPPILWANWTKAPVAAMMTAQIKTFLSWAQRSVRCIGDWSLSIMIQMA